MIDKETTHRRLNELYKVLSDAGYRIDLRPHGGFHAQRDGGYGVLCSMKVFQFLEGTAAATDVLKYVANWDEYISRIANDIENEYADVEEDLPQTWDEIRAEVAASTGDDR